MHRTLPLAPDERLNWRTSLPFLLVHLIPLAAVFTGISARAAVLAVVLYVGRMFFITAGYHRYFAHRSYRTNRVFQFLLAFGGTTAVQKGPLWWAGHHRGHHRHSDTEGDLHTPLKGFWHSHVGWILADKSGPTDLDAIRDFARYPELRFLDRHDWIGPWALGIASFLIAGWSGLVVGFFASTVLLWHGTFTVNSLAHVLGRRRYATTDTSRNSALIAFITLGEGWHNNHHHHQNSARQGFFWWEYDLTYTVLKVLSWFRIVRDLRQPPAAALAGPRVAEGHLDVGMLRTYGVKAAAALQASRVAIGEDLSARRTALAERLTAERDTVERGLASSLQAAEAYANLTRRNRKDLGFTD